MSSLRSFSDVSEELRRKADYWRVDSLETDVSRLKLEVQGNNSLIKQLSYEAANQKQIIRDLLQILLSEPNQNNSFIDQLYNRL